MIGAAVLSRQDAGPGRTAQGIGHECIGKADAVCGNPVEIWGLDIAAVIAAHHLGRMVVRHYEHDIVLLRLVLPSA